MNCCEHCADLARRVAALEAMVYRKHSHRRIILTTISAWPGPFTCQQIAKAIEEFHPEIAGEMKQYAIDNQVRKLERDGSVTRLIEGNGCNAAVFEVVGKVPVECGRNGPAYGRKAKYESGFRNIVRTALGDLPEEFCLDDLKAWMAEKIPSTQIPYGSLSSTLYKLEHSEELVCVRTHHYLRGKRWKRGPKQVTPNGEERAQLEQAWQEFRARMGKVEVAEPLPALQR